MASGFFQIALLLLLATAYLSVLATGRLDAATAAVGGGALLCRGFVLRGWLRIPLSNRWVAALTALYLGFYPVDFLYLSRDFVQATVRLVFFLAAIKTLTAKAGRDYLQLGLIAFLQLLCAAMLTSSAAFLGFLAVFLVLAVAARAGYEIDSSRSRATVAAPCGRLGDKLTTLSFLLASGVALAGAGLFFVVPRAASAYLSRLPASGDPVVGFSNEVTLGTIGKLKKVDSPVLRVRVLEGEPARDIKWHGGAWRYFDGTRWSNPPSIGQMVESQQGQYYFLGRTRETPPAGPQLHYRATRAPMDTDMLFLPGAPESVGGEFTRIEVAETGAISLPGTRWKPLRYEGWSTIVSGRPREARDVTGRYPTYVRSYYLQLPRTDPRIERLAHQITDNQLTPYWRAAALEHYLRTEFGYTLELPAEKSEDPLADFLFRRKKGHCEYFASAMTVMLRSIGIPARMVNGFLGGVFNPVSGYYTIRASEAHTWVEVYIPGFEWLTFDPTPPDPRGVETPAGGPLGRAWLYLDALETYWSDWVLQYDAGRQLLLARALQTQWYKAGYDALSSWERGWSRLEREWRAIEREPSVLFWAFGVIAAAMLAVMAVNWAVPRIKARRAARRIERGLASAADCALLYSRAVELIKRRGFLRHTWQTPAEFAAEIIRSGCPQGPAVLLREITFVYNRARFASDTQAARQLPALVRSLEALP